MCTFIQNSQVMKSNIVDNKVEALNKLHKKSYDEKVSQSRVITSTIVISALLISFPNINISSCMKAENGNIPKQLRVGHQNLGSGRLIKKFNEIDYLLMEKKPHVLGLSEIEMDNEALNTLLNEGNQVEIKQDNERISVIISSNIKYRRRYDLETPLWPVIWLELGTGNSRFLVCNLYREWQIPDHRKGTTQYHTRSKDDQLHRWKQFIEDWERALEEEVEIHVLGDFNLDRQKWKQLGNTPNPEVQGCVDELFDKIMSKGVSQTVTESTRVGNTGGGLSFSTLDLHFTNRANKVTKVEVT